MKTRTYTVPHAGNAAKVAAVREILPVWQAALCTVQMIQVRKLRSGGRIGWLTASETTLLGDNPLSARQVKSVTNQVNAALKSWQGIAASEGKRILREDASLTSELLSQVRLINAYRDWWGTSDSLTVGKGSEAKTIALSFEARKRGRKLIKQILVRTPFPRFGTTRTMLMDSLIAGVETSKESSFDRWVSISTLQRGKPVRLPLQGNPYLNSREGVELGLTQVTVTDDGIRLSRIYRSESTAPREKGSVIGVDWGMKCLLTTSEGDRLGQSVFARLSRLDEQLQSLESGSTVVESHSVTQSVGCL